MNLRRQLANYTRSKVAMPHMWLFAAVLVLAGAFGSIGAAQGDELIDDAIAMTYAQMANSRMVECPVFEDVSPSLVSCFHFPHEIDDAKFQMTLLTASVPDTFPEQNADWEPIGQERLVRKHVIGPFRSAPEYFNMIFVPHGDATIVGIVYLP